MNTSTLSHDPEADFLTHELPMVRLMNRLHAARRALLAVVPKAAAVIDDEFNELEEALAELPSRRGSASTLQELLQELGPTKTEKASGGGALRLMLE